MSRVRVYVCVCVCRVEAPGFGDCWSLCVDTVVGFPGHVAVWVFLGVWASHCFQAMRVHLRLTVVAFVLLSQFRTHGPLRLCERDAF